MSTKERITPTDEMIAWRREFLISLSKIKPQKPDDLSNLKLETGNKKIGKSGRFYNSVFVWNLPAVSTCPCASDWCLSHCYNADARKKIFPTDRWAQNWWMIENEPQILANNIINQIKNSPKPSAIRVHSSGDFYCENYIKFWQNIAQELNETIIWAYTRSWISSKLIYELNKLQSLKNVELFASWDSTMEINPPNVWRKCIVLNDVNQAEKIEQENRKYIICPEQKGMVDTCASCGICMNKNKKDIIFYFH